MFPIDIRLLSYDEERTDKPIESNTEREEVWGYSNHNREKVEHHLLHHSRIKCNLRRFIIFFHNSFCIFFFFFLLAVREWESCLDILESPKGESKHYSSGTTHLWEFEPVELSYYLRWVEVLEEAIEVIKVRGIVDLWYYPVETDKYRHLYEERNNWPHRIDSFGLVELEHLHAERCLVTLIFFLEGLYLRLYLLELLLSLKHMVLRNKEDDTYDDSDDDDSPTEWMSREPCEECYEEIVDRLIHCCREKCSDDSRFFCLKIYHPIS